MHRIEHDQSFADLQLLADYAGWRTDDAGIVPNIGVEWTRSLQIVRADAGAYLPYRTAIYRASFCGFTHRVEITQRAADSAPVIVTTETTPAGNV